MGQVMWRHLNGKRTPIAMFSVETLQKKLEMLRGKGRNGYITQEVIKELQRRGVEPLANPIENYQAAITAVEPAQETVPEVDQKAKIRELRNYGYTIKAIAEEIGVSVSTVRRRLA